MNNKDKGYTLIELIIVIAIIGILSSISISQYRNYVRKTAYTDVISVMTSYKTAVDLCFSEQSSLDACDTGSSGIPVAPTASTDRAFNTLTITNGVITATPNSFKGISVTETCLLSPNIDGKALIWTYSGSCVSQKYVTN